MPRPMRPAPTAANLGARHHSPSCRRRCSASRSKPGQAERVERARSLAQVASEEAADDGEQAVRDRRIHAGPARRRGEEGQAQLGVFEHVAVLVAGRCSRASRPTSPASCAHRRTSTGRCRSGRRADSAGRRSRAPRAPRCARDRAGRSRRAPPSACLRCGCPSARSAAAARRSSRSAAGGSPGPRSSARRRARRRRHARSGRPRGSRAMASSDLRAGYTPVGRRTARIVTLTSRSPCLRAR